MATKKSAEYDADSVKHLGSREAVQQKTAMYAGSTDEHGLFTCLRETTDNIIDEAINGYCTEGEVVVSKDLEYWVRDNGRGMPIGMMTVIDSVSNRPHKIPAIQAITSLLHAGGKLGDEEDSAYKISRGCFTGETSITLLSGERITFTSLYSRWLDTEEPIEILTYDLKLRRLTTTKIVDVILSKYVTKNVVVATSGNGFVECTEDHKFYTLASDNTIQEVAAGDLVPGTSLVSTWIDTVSEDVEALSRSDAEYTTEATTRTLVSVTNTKVLYVNDVQHSKEIPVFDLTVSHPDHVFFVNLNTDDKNNCLTALVKNSHGVGQKLPNFLSFNFEVFTFSSPKAGTPKYWHSIKYTNGKLTSELAKCPTPVHPVTGKKVDKGTIVKFKLNPKFFTAKSFPPSLLLEYLQTSSYFTPGFTWTLTAAASGKTKTYHSENGALDYITEYKSKLPKVASMKPNSIFICSSPVMDVAVDFTTAEGNHLKGFTNGLFNAEGGDHVDSFFRSLQKSLEPYKKKGKDFTLTEIKEGVLGIVNAKLAAPKFSSQVKVKLQDERAAEPFRKLLQVELDKFFKKNKTLAEAICARCAELKNLRSKFLASKQVVMELRKIAKKGFPVKALMAPKCKASERELYLVEGDSAMGGITGVRNAHFQEVFPLKGKIMNAHRATSAKFFQNEEVLNILAMIGFDPKAADPYSNLRVSKLVFMTDADADGPVVGSTRVLLCDGSNPTIKELADTGRDEFYVWASDTEGMLVKALARLPMQVKTITELYRITFDNGSVVECDAAHVWYLYKSLDIGYHRPMFTRAHHLEVGDRIPRGVINLGQSPEVANIEKGWLEVYSIEVLIVEPTPVYCLSVPGYKNFLIEDKHGNGILTGNCHISVLLLSMVHKYFPELIERGIIYVAEVPEFMAMVKNKPVYADSKDEMKKKLEDLNSPKANVFHFKGLGEMESDVLGAVGMNPATRMIRQITPTDSPTYNADFVSIVSGDAGSRRTLLGI